MIYFFADDHYNVHPGKVIFEHLPDDRKSGIRFFENDWTVLESASWLNDCELLILNLIGTTCNLPHPGPGAEKAVRKLLGDEVDYTIIPTKKGVLRIHSGHGKKERDENIRIGKYLVEKYGYEIDLVDTPSEKKSADSYNKTLGLTQEYKVNSTPTKARQDGTRRRLLRT